MQEIGPVPPSDLFAEQSVLGACLLKGDELGRVRALLAPTDFYQERHRQIFATMLGIAESKRPVDLFAVQDELKRRKLYEDCGGVAYLTDLCNVAVSPSQAEEYAAVVAELARRRRWVDGLRDVLGQSYNRLAEPGELVQKINGHAGAFLADGKRDGELLGIVAAETVEELQALARAGKSSFTTWGFTGLDLTCGGIPNKFVVMAGRPGMGKTSLMLESARRNAKVTGKWNLVFSLETSRKHLAINAIGSMAGVDTQDMQMASLLREEWGRAEQAAVRLLDAPVYIVDTPNLSCSDIHRIILRFIVRAREANAELGLVWLDHLQKVKPPSGFGSDTERITEISRLLAATQLEIDLPLVALSQLNRRVEERQNKRPMLSDLRQSGAIEQDARMVVFLYRDGYYQRMEGKREGDDTTPEPVEVNVAKNNGGKVGQCTLAFVAAWTKFADWDRRRD